MKSTPRIGHAPVQMKRVEREGDIDNAGEFAWELRDGVRYLSVALPRPSVSEPTGYLMNCLPVAKGDNVPGVHWGWDGDEEQPTLTPSVHCTGHWHGWIRRGWMVEA